LKELNEKKVLIGRDMIEYYNKLKEVDKRLEEISEWRQRKIDKIILKSGKKSMKALKKLGMTIPQEVKERRAKRSPEHDK